MIFARIEVAVFAVSMLAVGWLLYPSEYTRGMMLRQEGDRREAIAFFEDYLRRRPFHKGATLALVEAYEEAGRPEEAVRPLMEFYRNRRGDQETAERLIRLLRDLGEERRAAAFRWELVQDLKQKPVDTSKQLEELLYASLQEANARQDDEESLRIFAELVARSSGGGYLDEMLRLLLQRRRLDEALALLQEVYARDPRDEAVLRGIVRVHRFRKDYPAALAALAAGLAAVPDSVDLRADRAAVLVETRAWEDAAAEYDKLARRQPGEPDWKREKGYCLVQAGKIDEGAALYEELLRRNPGDPERWWSVIHTYADAGRHETAVERLEGFLRRFPRDEKAFDLLVYEYTRAGRLDQAISVLEAKVGENPEDARLRLSLLSLLRGEERYAETVVHYAALIRLQPRDKELRGALAFVYEQLDDPRSAALSLEEQLVRFPGDSGALDKLAWLYDKLGEREKAIALLQRHFQPASPRRSGP